MATICARASCADSDRLSQGRPVPGWRAPRSDTPRHGPRRARRLPAPPPRGAAARGRRPRPRPPPADTAGLRREEVAALAHMSTDYYTRLEQRRGSRPSEQMSAHRPRAAAHARRTRPPLPARRPHAPPPDTRTDHVSPALMRVLDRLDTPAQVVSDLGSTLRAEPTRRSAARRPDHPHGLRAQHDLPLVHRPESAVAYPVDDHAVQSRRTPRTPRRPRSRPGRPRAARAHRSAPADSPEFAALWESTRSDCPPRCANASPTPPSAYRTRLPDPHRREPDREARPVHRHPRHRRRRTARPAQRRRRPDLPHPRRAPGGSAQPGADD